jgi:hypothetical protein
VKILKSQDLQLLFLTKFRLDFESHIFRGLEKSLSLFHNLAHISFKKNHKVQVTEVTSNSCLSESPSYLLGVGLEVT